VRDAGRVPAAAWSAQRGHVFSDGIDPVPNNLSAIAFTRSSSNRRFVDHSMRTRVREFFCENE